MDLITKVNNARDRRIFLFKYFKSGLVYLKEADLGRNVFICRKCNRTFIFNATFEKHCIDYHSDILLSRYLDDY